MIKRCVTHVEAEMIRRVQAAVRASTQWLTTTEISNCIELNPVNVRLQLAELLFEQKLFCIEIDGEILYPSYALEIQKALNPTEGLHEVLQTFGESKNGWGLAYWFFARNSFLGGERPQNILRSSPLHVLQAAKDHLAGVQHG